MKKFLSILFSGIILTTGTYLSLDRHYCEGKLMGIRLSFDGRMATCGMEGDYHSDFPEFSLTNKCCENIVTCLNITGNYFPEQFILSHKIPVSNFLNIPVSVIQFGSPDISGHKYSVLPPGGNFKTAPTLPEICVFRT